MNRFSLLAVALLASALLPVSALAQRHGGGGGARSISMGGARPISMGGARPISMGGARPITMGGARPITMGGARPITMGGARPITVANGRPFNTPIAGPGHVGHINGASFNHRVNHIFFGNSFNRGFRGFRGFYGGLFGFGLGYGYGLGYGGYGFGYPYYDYPATAVPYFSSTYGSPLGGYDQYYSPFDLMPSTVPGLETLPSARTTTASLEIYIPSADAELWFNGVKTRQTGQKREFVTPELPPGKVFVYEVRAKWTEDGKQYDQTRTLTVQAGAQVVFAFFADEKEKLPPPVEKVK